MPSHTRITKRENRLIELFGPEKLHKDWVIAKKLAILFGDCKTQNRTFMRDVRIKKNTAYCLEKIKKIQRVKRSQE